jgi:uncharacterized protein (DUF1697 family)
MPRYAAFLRGVTPLNARMPELRRCFESAGFEDVRTLLSSGNVVFSSQTSKETMLARKAEAAMQAGLGRSFATIVKKTVDLQALLDPDPFAKLGLVPQAKRVITFLRSPPASAPCLPIELDGARILKVVGSEVFTAYLPSPKGPVFMALLERTFGKDITTRTVDTVHKCAWA